VLCHDDRVQSVQKVSTSPGEALFARRVLASRGLLPETHVVPDRPEMTQTLSSNLRAFGYVPERSELWVSYRNTPGYYIYEQVPDSVYAALLAARSKGRFMHAEVLDRFPFRQIEA